MRTSIQRRLKKLIKKGCNIYVNGVRKGIVTSVRFNTKCKNPNICLFYGEGQRDNRVYTHIDKLRQAYAQYTLETTELDTNDYVFIYLILKEN